MKIKGKWEYIVKPERVIIIEESVGFKGMENEVIDTLRDRPYNKFWYYFHGQRVVRFNAMTTTPDGKIWLAGEKGFIAYWNGNEWVNGGQWCHGEIDIYCLTTAPDGSIWAMGKTLARECLIKRCCTIERYKIARWDGSKWEDTTQNIEDIIGRGSFIFINPEGNIQACNSEGYAAYWNGNEWVDMGRWFTSSGWTICTGVTTPDGKVWVAGLDGMAACWDGKRWEVFDLWPQRSGDCHISKLVVTPDGILWAGGGSGLLAYWNGSKWVSCERWFCRAHEKKMVQEVQNLLESYLYSSAPKNPRYVYDEICDLTVAPDGSIWALTYTNDIARWVYEVEE